jgi:FkbM family methyltransferase
VNTVEVRYFGRTVRLPDLPEYRKFYRKLEAGLWEPDTFRLLEAKLDRSTVYIDVGGWIGVTPLWASHIAKHVVVVEPDPTCRAILRELVRSYVNVTLLEAALSPQKQVRLHAVDGFGSSETTALDIAKGQTSEAAGISANEVMRHAGASEIVVKIDIEGYEYQIVSELTRFAEYPLTALQLAVHPALYERTLRAPHPFARLLTLLATYRLVRSFRGLSGRPLRAKYRSVLTYLALGILLRITPRGTDLLFTPTQSN